MFLMALKDSPEEFKADAVALYLSDASKTYKQVAEDLGINRATLREWVLAAQRNGTAGAKARTAGKLAAGGQVASPDVL